MNWEIYSYGSGDMLRMVFTAIASIFGNDDYKAGMQTAGMIGFTAILVRSAFDRDLMANFRWIMTSLVLLMVLLVPKATVIVNDRISPQNTAVIQDVPLGLAATAGFFSFVGDWLSRSFETVFSMPNQVKYTTSGLLFPQKLYEATRKMGFPDDRTNNNFGDFFSSCVFLDGIGHKRFTWREVMEAPDLIDFFETRVAQYAAGFRYVSSSGSESIVPCRSGFKDNLKPDMVASYTNIIKYGMEGGFIARFDSAQQAQTKINDSMQGAMRFMTGVTTTNQKYVVQQAIINSMSSSSNKLAQEIGATTYANYIQSGAETSRLLSYQALGNVASEKLPLLRIIFEAIIYAVFPIIALMAIVLPTKVPFAYLTALVWINLWAPMYAILHFIMAYYTQSTMTEIAALYGNGYSVFANTEMAKFNSDVVATTGYIATSIPMLAWMLVSRSGAMASSIAGRVMQGYDQSVEKGASEVTAGSGARGGVGWRLVDGGGMQTSALMGTGTEQITTGNGDTMFNQTTSSLLVSPQAIENVSKLSEQALSTAVSVKESAAANLTEKNSAVLADAGAVMTQIGKHSGVNQTFSESEAAQIQKMSSDVDGIIDKYQHDKGVIVNNATRAAIKADMGLDVPKALSVVSPVSAKAGVSVEGSQTESESSSASVAAAFTNSEQYSEAVSSVASGVRQMAVQAGVDTNDSSLESLSASLSKQKDAQITLSRAVDSVESATETNRVSENFSHGLTKNQSQALVKIGLTATGGDGVAVDRIIRDAASGNPGATNILAGWVNDLAGNDIATNLNFSSVQNELHNRGKTDVNDFYASGSQDVDDTAKRQRKEVDSEAVVSKEDVNNAIVRGLQSQQQTMDNPSNVYTDNGTNRALDKNEESLGNKGSDIKKDVEDPINDTFDDSLGSYIPDSVTMWFDKKQ